MFSPSEDMLYTSHTTDNPDAPSFCSAPPTPTIQTLRAFAEHLPHRQSQRFELLLYISHTATLTTQRPLPTTPSRIPFHRHRSRSLSIYHRNSSPYYTYDDNSDRAPHPTTCGRALSHPHYLSAHHFRAATPTCPHTLPTVTCYPLDTSSLTIP